MKKGAFKNETTEGGRRRKAPLVPMLPRGNGQLGRSSVRCRTEDRPRLVTTQEHRKQEECGAVLRPLSLNKEPACSPAGAVRRALLENQVPFLDEDRMRVIILEINAIPSCAQDNINPFALSKVSKGGSCFDTSARKFSRVQSKVRARLVGWVEFPVCTCIRL
jgi:hypothetical protein